MSIPNGFVISLTPSRLSVILVSRGAVRQSESVPLPVDWDGIWADGLIQLDQPLRQLLSRFPKRSAGTATLVYESKTVTKQISIYQQGGAYARDAARSKLREMVGLDTPVCVHTLSGEGAGSSTAMLAYADRDDTLRSLYAWLNRCAVRVGSMIPLSVASIMVAAEQARHLDEDTAVFYFDAHCSVFCHARDGDLTLVRPSDIGYEKLAEAYSQVLREHASEQGDEEQQEPEGVGIQRALECLFEHGIPFQPIHRDGMELRSCVLPRMAPVLQRVGIDVKQTIRFGLGGQHALKNLIIAGAGVSIPSITRALSEHVELHIQLAPGHEQFDSITPGGKGTTEQQFIEYPRSIPALLPRIAGDERDRKRMRLAVAVGAVAALTAVGAQFGYYTHIKNEATQRMQDAASRYDRVTRFENTQAQALQVRQWLCGIAELVADETRPQPCWEAPLAELGTITGGGIRIQELQGEHSAEHPVLVINGYSVSEGDLSPGQVLDRFVEEVSRIDRVRSVRLGATNRISVERRHGAESEWGSQFTLKVVLDHRRSPYELFADAATKETDWTTP